MGNSITGVKPLLVQFRDNDTSHDDLHVWVEGYSCATDSYYFALDSSILAGDESADKVRHVLIQLLQRWIEALMQATPTRPVYLPFDFSDQYTGCFQCSLDGDFFEIVSGWSSREGWSLLPSNPGDYFSGVTAFKSYPAAPVRLPKAELLRRIRESITDAESQLSSAHDPA